MDKHDLLINFGGDIKAVSDDDFDLEGELMVFTAAGVTDLDDDRFDSKRTNTKRKVGDRLPIYSNHGFDPHFGNTELGYWVISNIGEKSVDVKGKIEIERGGELDAYLANTPEGKAAKSAGAEAWDSYLDEEYEQYKRIIIQKAKEKKLRLSSGANKNMIRKDGEVFTSWPLIEGSLLIKAAEPKTSVTSLKSFSEQPIKSLYSDAMARQKEPTIWEACSILQSKIYQITGLQANAEGTEYTINGEQDVESILVDFVADIRLATARLLGVNTTKSFRNLSAELRESMPIELQIKAARDAEFDSATRLIDFAGKKEKWGKKAVFLEKYGAIINEVIADKEIALKRLQELAIDQDKVEADALENEMLMAEIEFESLEI